MPGRRTAVQEGAQIQTVIRQFVADIQQLREQMRRDQSEIEKSRDRTRAMLAQLQADLVKLEAR